MSLTFFFVLLMRTVKLDDDDTIRNDQIFVFFFLNFISLFLYYNEYEYCNVRSG